MSMLSNLELIRRVPLFALLTTALANVEWRDIAESLFDPDSFTAKGEES